MAGWVLAAIDRLPPRARRVVVAAPAVLLLAGAIAALTLEGGPGGGARRRMPITAHPSRPAPARPPPSVNPPVSARDLRAARVVAARFLLPYLRFAYGRRGAGWVKAVTPELRSQLIRQRAQATPVERGRRPRVVSLAAVGTSPGFVVATATVEDGGVAGYRLRFALQERAGSWRVSNVQEG